jgi:L-glutamine:scyllo-inosose aminotransferase/L-glutamine:2-deoxy-scyllo-inosose/3-amino-2,3-dideoxy-scyllo-inosose aminotransferase
LKNESDNLALLGGEPVRKTPWPIWPRADENTERLLKDVLYSGRWTISGYYVGKKPYERQFAEAFAEFNNVPYCVPTASGSSALKIALAALDVGYNKKVLVPGLTWVACASSVIGLGAVPILVDIEPDTLCMSLESAKKSITKNTAAIMLVHLYSRVADLDGFLKISEETGIPIIEDCSQAHGALWKGQRVGTFGRIGVFSMQQSKILTCGEGGAVITKDKDLYEKMQEFRADGRRYKSGIINPGEMELEEIGSVQGNNHCMSEFQAAILLDRLQHLDEESKIREKNARHLNSLLVQSGDLSPLVPSPETNRAAYYQYCVRVNIKAFDNIPIDLIAQALTAELGILIKPVYTSLNRHVLYNPLSSPHIVLEQKNSKYNPKYFNLPNAEKASMECVAIPHQILLGSEEEMENVARAFKKIKMNHKALLKQMEERSTSIDKG